MHTESYETAYDTIYNAVEAQLADVDGDSWGAAWGLGTNIAAYLVNEGDFGEDEVTDALDDVMHDMGFS